jgi:hypothetical protein
MVKADGAGNLPAAIFVLPQRDELGFSHVTIISGVTEAMDTDLHRAIVVSPGTDLPMK